MTTSERIGVEVQEAREAKGWTIYRLSQESGLQETHLRRIEEGRYNLRVDVAERAAKALGITLKIG